MENTANQPIGIFDSGIGGLTVAHAITQVLPLENIIYFGDTAHLPYGDKSTAAIQAYSVKICDMLLKQKVKAIVIACNSASAAAYELVREYVGSKAKVLNVIDPTIRYMGQHYAGQRVGLIGTKQTVFSNIYRKKTDELDRDITLCSLATPLLAPMIEEGFFNHNISQNIINEYLSSPVLADIQALILACTHYPLIKHDIESYYKENVQVLDSSLIVAESLQNLLAENNLLRTENPQPTKRFYVSDYTESFEHSTKYFFQEEVQLEHYPLWE